VALPIKRVIVGPTAGDQGVTFAKSLVGSVPVSVSHNVPS